MASEQLLLLIKAETQKAVQEMKKMNNSISKTQAGIKKTVQGFKNFAMKALVVVAAVKGLINVFKSTTKAYEKQLAAETKLEAALKATGYAVGITSEEMKAFASEMQQTTVFGDEMVINAQAIMTTFTKIGKDVFPEAIERAADMSTMFGQDLQQSVIQLGTALNDPIAGIGRLKRIGISFSEEQRDQIKNFMEMNDVASAQAVILDELGAEFGGVSKEMGKTPIGIFKKFDNTMSDLQETIGMYISSAAVPLAESFTKMAEGVTAFLKSKQGMQEITNILNILAGVGSVISTIFGQLYDLFKGLGEDIINTTVEEFSNLVGEGNEANIIFNVLGGVVKAISIGFTVFAEIIKASIRNLANLIGAVSKSVDILGKFGEALFDPMNQDKWDAVGKAVEGAGNAWIEYGTDLIQGYKDVIGVAVNEISGFIDGTVENARQIEEGYEGALNVVNSIMEGLKENSYSLVGTLSEVPEQVELIEEEIDEIKEEYAEKERERQRKMVEDALSFADQMVSGLGDIFGMHYNNQGIKLDNQYKKEKEAIEKNVKNEEAKNKALAKLDEQYAQKRGAIKTKQAKSEKTWGIIQSVIDTATAVMKTFAQLGFPFGIPAAIAVGAMGIAKTAMIASQPIPKFEQGGAFTVPAGYEDDSFLMRAKSGEEVNIRRPDQAGQPINIKILLGGDTIWDKTYQASINGDLLIDSRALV